MRVAPRVVGARREAVPSEVVAVRPVVDPRVVDPSVVDLRAVAPSAVARQVVVSRRRKAEAGARAAARPVVGRWVAAPLVAAAGRPAVVVVRPVAAASVVVRLAVGVPAVVRR